MRSPSQPPRPNATVATASADGVPAAVHDDFFAAPTGVAIGLVTSDAALRDLVAVVAEVERLAVDVEASGMFAYHSRPCTVQLAWDGGRQVRIVDVLATSIDPLAHLLGADGPVKVIHDVAFDARLLAECGIRLGNVHDTSVAARMLSRSATGLATLLGAEIGVHITKALQQHDWRRRPLDGPMLDYLAADVVHLEVLEQKLWAEATALGIEDAIVEETRYRMASAFAAACAPIAPPYARVKGSATLTERELAALRVAAELREREAQVCDVPPHQVASADALLLVARRRPESVEAISTIRGLPTATLPGQAFAAALVEAVRSAGDRIPDDERVHFEPARLCAEEARRRRQRETGLTRWRRAEAKRRGVDEQVILPGHCLRDAAGADIDSAGDLARVAGIGAFRIQQYGDAICDALRSVETAGPQA